MPHCRSALDRRPRPEKRSANHHHEQSRSTAAPSSDRRLTDGPRQLVVSVDRPFPGSSSALRSGVGKTRLAHAAVFAAARPDAPQCAGSAPSEAGSRIAAGFRVMSAPQTAHSETVASGATIPVRQRRQVCVSGREPARAWLLHAFTGHAGAVTAFLCDSEATRSTHETAGFVPDRERRCSAARRSDRRADAKVSRRRRDGWSSPQALDRARSPVLLLVPQLRRQCRSSARSLRVTTDRAVSQHEARPNETPLPLADRPGDGKRARRLTVAITAERHSRRRRTGRFPDSSDAITSSADGRAVGTPGGAALSASRAIGALPIAHRRERGRRDAPFRNAVAKREPAARAPGPYYAESVSTSAAFIRRTRTPG